MCLLASIGFRAPAGSASTTCGPSTRPTSSSASEVTSAELRFDLCRLAYELGKQRGREHAAASARRLETIAEEARLIGACPNPRPSKDNETQSDFIDKHSFGCGPYHIKATMPDQKFDADTSWVTAACPTTNARPSYEPIAKPSAKNEYPFGGTHSPITYAQVQFDACYIAARADAQVKKGSTSYLLHLIDQLQYEFDQVGCIYGRRPSQKTTDYALYRKFGCGTYPPLPKKPTS